MRALRFLLRKEFRQIFRDRVILGMLFVMPMVQLLLLANAATFEVRNARLYVVDHDQSRFSRGVTDRFIASGRFSPAGWTQSLEVANRAMLRRDADVILVISEGFESDIVRERRGALQLTFNAEDGAAAGVAQSYANRILSSYSRELDIELHPGTAMSESRAAAPSGRSRAVIDLRERGWYNAELEYRDYMIPAILVILVTVIGSLLTAMNIVREKEAGTLEQLNVTPVTRSAFIAAKLLPLWSLALVALGFGLGLARLVFDLPTRGNPAVIFLAAAIYLLCALGIGLWISTVAETQQQAMFVTFSVLMVYLLMSGLFTPLRSMPHWAQAVAQLSPVMHFTHLMRAVLLKSAGIMDVARELVILSAMGAAILIVAVRRYSKRAG